MKTTIQEGFVSAEGADMPLSIGRGILLAPKQGRKLSTAMLLVTRPKTAAINAMVLHSSKTADSESMGE